MDDSSAADGCAACAELSGRLAKPEEKRERMRNNLHKFREKIIDTNKLLGESSML